ncbi:MAG: carboxypeptidase-like regulatory domain-containing protein [Chitinispirillales bacterium]|nr:carboxypeptidase-like regulatory domain-containing protein [Chitinispirillales bacterium]
MAKKTGITVLLVLTCCFAVFAGQEKRFTVVRSPLEIKNVGDTIFIDWVGGFAGSVIPDSAAVYFSSSPKGGDLSKYEKRVTPLKDCNNVLYAPAPSDPGNPSSFGLPQRRGIRFRPADQNPQNTMSTGIHYCVVGSFKGRDTIYSNEFTLMIDSDRGPVPQSPSREISNLTPEFSWSNVPNVPYYHVILSDRPLPLEIHDDGSASLNGDLSIVWQAITTKNRITYGEPDPSGTITAAPPPLSPGKTYSWLVLNNFGNHTAFSSPKLSFPPFLEFTVSGSPLNPPKVVSPKNVTIRSDAQNTVDFKWTNLDTNAGAYLVNLMIETDPKDLLGNDLLGAGVKGDLLVWETTVSRGGKRADDTLSTTLNAKAVLTGGNYRWRVFALDSRGAGTTGDTLSSASFTYEVPFGNLEVITKEVVMDGNSGGTEIRVPVVELRSEVLSGPMEKPFAFYTGITDGYAFRARPAGTYRIQAVKEGYKTEVRTVSVTNGQTTTLNIFMERAQALIFGKVTDTSGIPLNQVNVVGVSEWGDTVAGLTNGSGGFTLAASNADWTVYAGLTGYKNSSPQRVSVRNGQSRELNIELQRNAIVFNGSVRNPDGGAILGARVRIFREGNLVSEIPSTPQNGAFTFHLSAGRYTLSAEKAGFTTYGEEVTVSGSRTHNIVLNPGAMLVNGMVMGRSWSAGGNEIFAPIPSAVIKFWDKDNPSDIITVTSDAVFGKFSAGLKGGKIYMYESWADGYVSKTAASSDTIITISGSTKDNFSDTLYGLAMISGRVVDKNDNNRALSGIDIGVFDVNKNQIIATGRSANDGSFEVRNIPDGSYRLNAASISGYYLAGGIPFEAANGKPDLTQNMFELEFGNNKIKWNVVNLLYQGIPLDSISIKPVSPFMNTVSARDSITNAGAGDYVIEAEIADGLRFGYLNLSYRKFSVSGSGQTVTDTIFFPFTHTRSDTLSLNDTVRVTGTAASDSARLYYRSEGSSAFSSVKGVRNGNSYSFVLAGGVRDGSNLYYYFRVYTPANGGDIYGSQKQTYRSFIRPESTIITHFEVVPGTGSGTLVLPSSYGAQFSLRAFAGSSFLPYGDMAGLGNSVVWSLKGSSDNKLEERGINVTVRTGSKKSDTDTLIATLSKSVKLADGVSNVYKVPFSVSGSVLKSMTVSGIGFRASEAVANTDEAQFTATGTDAQGKQVVVSPQWSISPGEAGSIDGYGKYTPNARFLGRVRVFASAGGINAEFNPVSGSVSVNTGVDVSSAQNGREAGLSVSYVLKPSNRADTVTNFKGLKAAFQPGSIGAGYVERFEVSLPDVKNQMKKSGGGFRLADSVSFDITPKDGGTRLDFTGGKITVILGIPAALREEARKNQNFWIARWNPDSLFWVALTKESNISEDGSTVSAAVSSFSEYALVTKPGGFSASLNVSPHPFSPFIRPVKEHGPNAQAGTCIRVGVNTPGERVASIKVHIFNSLGHRVWAVEKLNADVGEHKIWWDGRTTSREETWSENFNEKNKNRPMCRNGRYFVTAIIKDHDGKQKRVMKPVVLMK